MEPHTPIRKDMWVLMGFLFAPLIGLIFGGIAFNLFNSLHHNPTTPAPFWVVFVLAVLWSWVGWCLFKTNLLFSKAAAVVAFWSVSVIVVYHAMMRLLGRE